MPELEELKDIHKGKRCFVFGNGPSIRDIDLSLIQDEYIFVTNDFHMHELWPKLKNVFYIELSGVTFLGGGYNKWKHERILRNPYAKYCFQSNFKNAYVGFNLYPKDRMYFLTLDRKNTLLDGHYNYDIAKDGSSFASSGVIEGAMALAQYMGFTTIYLCGCDATPYFVEDGKGGYKVSDDVYFFNWKDTPEIFWPRVSDKDDIVDIRSSWVNLDKYMKEKGVNIYNMSQWSTIDVFPKVKYEDIVSRS